MGQRASEPDLPATGGPPAHHRDPAEPVTDPDALAAWVLRPVGVVRSPYRYVHDAPRQPGLAGAADVEGRIVLRQGMQNCLHDLSGFERIWVVFVLSYARGWREMVTPPRGHRPHGVLATRAPHRPNPIGLSCVRVREVRGRTITVVGHDLLDGTPVLDVKPYIPYADAFPDARAGWVDELEEGGPDHRWE
jgi:tRNA-Thr(GGU) m(6)t(6)A37 methyltransferase TsaA